MSTLAAKTRQLIPKRLALRPLWLALHLYLGLSAGLIIALAGVTGSLLVFYIEIDEWLNPALIAADTQQPPLSYEAIFQSITRAHPERNGPWRLEMPRNPSAMLTARYYKPAETAQLTFAPLMVSVNPYTGEVVASRFWGQFAMTWLYDLHYTLLLDQPGKIIMAMIGGCFAVSIITGTVLWWPKTGKFKTALSLKRRASPERFNYDLHKLNGVYSLPLLAVLAVTGICLEIPEYVNPIIHYFSAEMPMAKLQSTLPNPAAPPRIRVDEAIAIAQQQYPDTLLRWVETPNGATGTFRVNLYQAGEPSQRFPKTNLWIDQYSGSILDISNPHHGAAGDTLIHWFHPLHSGEALGLTGRLLIFLAGIACPVLYVTGIIRWLQKRRAKRLHR